MGGAIGGLFGGGGPSQPNVQVYQPSGTSSQDSNLQNLLSQSYGNLYGSSNPYTQTMPQAQSIYGSLYNSPYASAYQTAAGNAGAGYTNTGNTALMNSTALSGGIPQLMAGANQVYQTGLDPQQALYNQQFQRTNDQANVSNAQYGLTGQQAAGNTQQADTNFNIDWQNNELSRQIAGLGGAAGAMGAAGSLGTTAAGLGGTGAGQLTTGGATPYGASASIAGQQQNALQAYIQQLLGPTTSTENTIGQQQNYLNTGVNASAQGANAALSDYYAQLQNSSNIGSGIGDILGLGTHSGGTVGGSLLSGLGSLGTSALSFLGL